jgi:hypothetical protein
MKESIKLENNKYEVVVDATENDIAFYANRYGETWRDLTGDKLVMAMFYRIQELEEIEYMYNDLCK